MRSLLEKDYLFQNLFVVHSVLRKGCVRKSHLTIRFVEIIITEQHRTKLYFVREKLQHISMIIIIVIIIMIIIIIKKMEAGNYLNYMLR